MVEGLGVKFKFNTRVGKDITIEELKKHQKPFVVVLNTKDTLYTRRKAAYKKAAGNV